nr:sex-regulated protein janus-A-like [Halyomorpha halys]
MSTDLLNAVPNVEIDPQGIFKYVLIRVYAPQTPDGSEPSKMIVRGNRRGAYHADIYDETVQKLNALELDSECIGGGRIQHDPLEKKIKVYGYSQGFGKADHEVSVEILKEVYGDYEITWSDEGY